VVLAFPFWASAQTGASTPASAVPAAPAVIAAPISRDASSIGDIAVSVQMSESSQIPMTLSGLVTVKNQNPSKKVTLALVKLKAHGRLLGVYGEDKVLTIKDDELPLEKGASKDFPFELKPQRDPSWFEHASFRSGPAEFYVSVTYYPDGEQSKTTVDVLVKPEVTTSIWYVVIGGFFGSVLLVLFMASSKLLAAARAEQMEAVLANIWRLSGKWSLIVVAYAINGIVVALLLVLLSAGLSSFQMPIAFKLQDFSGGLLVGLFSVTLAKFVSDKLLPSS
jgi:hypothetical protein